MSDQLQDMLAETDPVLRKCRKWQLINRPILAMQLANAAASLLDIWSVGSWIYIISAIISIGASIIVWGNMRWLRRRIRVYQAIRLSILRLIDGERVFHLTPNPLFSALEQLEAGIDNLKRI